MMVTTTRHITVEDLERDGVPEGQWEIVNGELIEMPPAGGEPSRLALEIGSSLVGFVKPRRLGQVYGADGGFVLSEHPLTLRSPDVGFVKTERLPENFRDGGYLRVVPDLVVEVISPSDRMVRVLAKVVMWLEAGVALLWLANPVAMTVTVYTSDDQPRVLSNDDILDGGNVLPGFSIPVREIFAT
jgi:Uma2 family endonuclease